MKLVGALLLLAVIQTVSGNMILDEWMKRNNLPIDHLHDKATFHRAKGERIRLRVQQDDISSKASFEGLTLITSIIVNLQRTALGAVKGVETIRPDRVCSGALNSVIDEAFKLIEYRFIWLPDVQVKFF